MPTKSLQRGDYSLLLAIESASRQGSWYRVLTDRQTGTLSCDCPPWTFARHLNALGQRTCAHTDVGQRLAAGGGGQASTPPLASPSTQTLLSPPTHTTPLIEATRTQWPGLRGQWSLEAQEHVPINNHPYTFVLLRLALGNGSGTATGVAAFAERHGITTARMRAGVAGWCGYAIAAEVARLGGYPLVGQPPEHFSVKPATRASRGLRPQATATTPLVLPQIALTDILKIGDEAILADGLRPEQRAENTLRLFLGEQVYAQLERQGFLDVSSVHYGIEERVYRVRRDPHKRRERRVRVFEHGRYLRDYCLIRGQDVPEADHFLTLFLGLLSDEMGTLSVLGRYNIFEPQSDGDEPEVIPVRWQKRTPQPVC